MNEAYLLTYITTQSQVPWTRYKLQWNCGIGSYKQLQTYHHLRTYKKGEHFLAW